MRNPEQTRRKLVATAAQLLLAKGHGGLRVDDVAASARVNKRMIYHYFQHKEGLYQAVLHSQIETLMAEAELLTDGVKDFLLTEMSSSSASVVEQSRVQQWSNGVVGQELEDAAVIVLRAVLDKREFTRRLDVSDWNCLVHGLMALALPGLADLTQSDVEGRGTVHRSSGIRNSEQTKTENNAGDESPLEAAKTEQQNIEGKVRSERSLTEKPRYTGQALHRVTS
ncbi:MAG: TetR/AcrR family transcriptional regulator [Pseudomonadales bacterium]|nr:TetR/AcrR family transcriptional regulator [Pseudomonadales bacterium]